MYVDNVRVRVTWHTTFFLVSITTCLRLTQLITPTYNRCASAFFLGNVACVYLWATVLAADSLSPISDDHGGLTIASPLKLG